MKEKATYEVRYVDGRNGNVCTEPVPCKTSAVDAVCKAAHRILHGAKKLTTYQLVSIDGVKLPYDLTLICW